MARDPNTTLFPRTFREFKQERDTRKSQGKSYWIGEWKKKTLPDFYVDSNDELQVQKNYGGYIDTSWWKNNDSVIVKFDKANPYFKRDAEINGIKKILKDLHTPTGHLKKQTDTQIEFLTYFVDFFVDIGLEYGIAPRFLIAASVQEAGWGDVGTKEEQAIESGKGLDAVNYNLLGLSDANGVDEYSERKFRAEYKGTPRASLKGRDLARASIRDAAQKIAGENGKYADDFRQRNTIFQLGLIYSPPPKLYQRSIGSVYLFANNDKGYGEGKSNNANWIPGVTWNYMDQFKGKSLSPKP